MQRELFTANGLATELGLDRRTVALALGGVAPDGKIGSRDAWLLRTFWAATKQEANRKAAGASNGNGVADDASNGSYTHERARLTAEKAKLAEMERLEREGKLVPVEQVEQVWGALSGVIRTRLLALPAKCAARLGMAKNAIEAQAILKAEVHELLKELAGTVVRVDDSASTIQR